MVTSRGIISAQVVWPNIRLKECRSTSVESLFTTMPLFCRPRKAMNRPMPGAMAAFTAFGMASKITRAEAGDGKYKEHYAVHKNHDERICIGEAHADAYRITQRMH